MTPWREALPAHLHARTASWTLGIGTSALIARETVMLGQPAGVLDGRASTMGAELALAIAAGIGVAVGWWQAGRARETDEMPRSDRGRWRARCEADTAPRSMHATAAFGMHDTPHTLERAACRDTCASPSRRDLSPAIRPMPQHTARLATLAIATLATTATLPAQRLEDVPVDAQLVVTLRDSISVAAGNPVVRGQFLGADRSQLVVRVPRTGATQALDRRAVVGVAWVQRTGMSGGKGALIGFGTGVALTWVASMLVAQHAPPSDFPPVVLPIVLGTLTTAGLTVLGAVVGHERRERAVPIAVEP